MHLSRVGLLVGCFVFFRHGTTALVAWSKRAQWKRQVEAPRILSTLPDVDHHIRGRITFGMHGMQQYTFLSVCVSLRLQPTHLVLVLCVS